LSRRFNGSTDLISCASPAVLDNLTGGLTIGCWIYASNFGANSKGYIVGKGTSDSTNTTTWRIANATSGGADKYALRFEVMYSDGFGLFRETANASFTLNTWYYVIVTWGGSNARTDIHMYSEGVECTYGAGGEHNGGTTHDDSAGNWVIGERPAQHNRTWSGDLYGLRAWASVISSTNFASMRLDGTVGTPVGWWAMNGTADPEPDTSGNGNDGVLTGTTGSSNPPAIGTAHTSQSIPGTAKIHATLTKTLTGVANIFPSGRHQRPITGVAAITPGLVNATWTALPAPTQVPYASLSGTYDPRGWDKLEYDPTSGKFWTWDGYLASDRAYTIYGNALWQYDQGSNKLILYKIINWQWTAPTYVTSPTPENAADPTPYDRHSYQGMCVVPSQNKLYLWGGANTTKADNWKAEFWSYDLAATPGTVNSWTLISTSSDSTLTNSTTPTLPPYASFEQCMVNDTQNGQLIVFSARNDHGFVQEGRDTFTYNLAAGTWAKRANASGDPGARLGHSMCWDSSRNCVWMFGGSGASPYPQLGNELWKYVPATNTWSQPTTTGGPPRTRRFGNWAYDSQNDVCVLFGGSDVYRNAGDTADLSDSSFVGLNDTWVFRPGSLVWQQLSPSASPTASESFGNKLAYDSVNNYFVYNAMGTEGKFYLFRYGSTPHASQTITGKAKIKAHIPQTITGVANITPNTAKQTQTITGKANIAAGPLSVQITVSETLPLSVPGLARSLSPVSVGIPIPESANISSVSQLGMTGPTAYQFRILGNYASGKAKWVLCDFLDSVSAGGSSTAATLTSGTGALGSNMATDGATISVDTGAAVFSVVKAPFKMFDAVTVGGTSVVTTGGTGVTLLVGGIAYSSANDNSATTTVEENGPVRVCVLSKGALKNGGGTRLMDYTVRLHFYKGKSYCRAFVTLRNAKESSTQAPVVFDSVEVSLKVGTSASTFVTKTSLDVSPLSIPLSAAETAYAYQAYSTKYQATSSQNDYATAPMNTAVKGVAVVKGATTYHAQSGNTSDYVEWAALEDSGGKGVTMVMPYMAQYWPAGFEVSQDGSCSVQLFSKRNSKTGIKFAFLAHETRELFFDFHATTPASRSTALYEAQYSLQGRASVTQYASTGAIFGETQLVSQAEQDTWYTTLTAVSGPPGGVPNVVPGIIRWWSWNQGSGNNQTDFAVIDFIDWIRTGYGGYWWQGFKNTWFKSHNAVPWSDDWDMYLDQINAGDETGGTNLGTFNSYPFQQAHPHFTSLMLGYYMTGQMEFYDAVYEYGEYEISLGDGISPLLFYNPTGSFDNVGSSFSLETVGDMRIWSRYLRNFAAIWDFTRNPRYYSMMSLMVNSMLNSTEVPGSVAPAGRNRRRGYMWMSHGAFALPRTVSDFFTSQIHFEAVWYAKMMLAEQGATATVLAIEDYLLGLGDFMYYEMFFDLTGSGGAMGYLYTYYLDVANNSTNNPHWPPLDYLRMIAGGRCWTFMWQMTGDTKYLDRGRLLLVGDAKGQTDAGVSFRTPSDFPQQAFMYNDLYRPETGWINASPVSAFPIGLNKYRVFVTLPSTANGVRVRAAPAGSNIVDWLGFSQDSRTYIYGSTGFTPWFAGVHFTDPDATQVKANGFFDLTGTNIVTQYGSFMVKYTTGTTPVSTPRTIQGKAKILAHVPQTITGKSRILKHVPQTITGVASILPPSTTRAVYDITGVAKISTGPGPSTWIHGTTPYGQWKKGR
jgi:hypothetical protein